MIPKPEAIEIAKHAVQIELGYFPTDAVLTFADVYNDIWIIQWRHKRGIVYSETDKIVVQIDSITGELRKVIIGWTPLAEKEIKKTLQASPTDIIIVEYRKIMKELYFLYDKTAELEDYYWIGTDNKRIYLAEESDGEFIIVGEAKPIPSSKAANFDGQHYEVPYKCVWEYLKDRVKPYLEKWFGEVTEKMNCPPTRTELEVAISDMRTKILFIVAHCTDTYAQIAFEPSYLQLDAASSSNPNIHDSLSNRSLMRLAIVFHCGAADTTGMGTFAYEYTKGHMQNATFIGLRKTTDASWVAAHGFFKRFIRIS